MPQPMELPHDAVAQALFWQMSPTGQTLPHMPQLRLSSSTSAQTPLQHIWTPGHPPAQTPPEVLPEVPPLVAPDVAPDVLEEAVTLPLVAPDVTPDVLPEELVAPLVADVLPDVAVTPEPPVEPVELAPEVLVAPEPVPELPELSPVPPGGVEEQPAHRAAMRQRQVVNLAWIIGASLEPEVSIPTGSPCTQQAWLSRSPVR